MEESDMFVFNEKWSLFSVQQCFSNYSDHQ